MLTSSLSTAGEINLGVVTRIRPSAVLSGGPSASELEMADRGARSLLANLEPAQ